MGRALRALWMAAATTVATFVVGLAPAAATDFATGPLVQVSGTTGTSPFDDCNADAADDQSGTFFPRSEVEPWIDVDPTHPDNMAGMWQQDRWSNGGARGHVVGVSDDGGSTWDEVVLPGVTLCSEGDYQRTTDPWLSFGPDGTLYQISLSFNDIAPPFTSEDFDHALLASKSDDGGRTWTDPEVVIRDTAPTVFNDKQTITADPTRAGNVYAVWDRLVFPPGERANVIASFVTAAFRGPIWFARTTDGGKSWEPARPIYDPGQNNQTISSQIVVRPDDDGTLVNLFAELRKENKERLRGWSVKALRSTDQGTTWSGPIHVNRLQTIGITDPETGNAVRTGDIIPDIAVNPRDGRLYAVWQDARFSGFENDSIAFSQSLDGGLTWSNPIKVNATPTNIPAGNQQAFTASVHVAGDDAIAVTYYDFRNNDSNGLGTDHWAVHCHPDPDAPCTDPANWGDEIRITDETFDMRQAPDAGGFFVGDYVGLASAVDDFTPFFSQPDGSDDPSSVFFRRVGPEE